MSGDAETRIRVYADGERCYVLPFARHRVPAKNRFFRSFGLGGHRPYDNDWSLVTNANTFLKQEFDTPWQRLRWWWAKGVGQRLWDLGQVWHFYQTLGLRMAWWRWVNRQNTVTFIAASYPDLRMRIPHQLRVDDPDEITETVYLLPRKEWVAAQLEKHGPTDEYHVEDYNAYLSWKMFWEPYPDHEIDYLLVLDT